MTPILKRLCVTVLVTFLLASCSSSPVKNSISIYGQIVSSGALNPDIKGAYKPVNLKVFYLKSEEEFEKAKFADLYSYPDKALGASIIDLKTYQVQPGESIELDGAVSNDLKFIGVIAAFRDIENANWKDIKSIPEKCFICTGDGLWDPVVIKLDRLSVSLSTSDED